MNIGIDIDDTISETFETLLPYSQKYTVEDLKRKSKIQMDNNSSNHFYIVYMNGWSEQEAVNFWDKYYGEILRNLNNDTSGFVKNDTLIQYNHDFSVCTFSNEKISSKQINGSENNFIQGSIGGKDYIGMSPDSSISYNLKKLKPGEEKELTIFVYINKIML